MGYQYLKRECKNTPILAIIKNVINYVQKNLLLWSNLRLYYAQLHYMGLES